MKIMSNPPSTTTYPLTFEQLRAGRMYEDHRGEPALCVYVGCIISLLRCGGVAKFHANSRFTFRELPPGHTVTLEQTKG